MKTWIAAVGILGLVLPAAADEVILKNGASFEGVVHEKGEQVVVEMDFGTMTFPRKDVSSINRAEGPIHELNGKVKNARTADEHYELGTWASQNGLAGRGRDLYRRTIELDPNHEKAREALGYVRHEGRWLTQDELMAAKGLVQYQGRWVAPEERARLMEKEMELAWEMIRLQATIEAYRQHQEMVAAQQRAERERSEGTRFTGRTSTQPVPALPFTLPLSGVPWGLPLSGVPQPLPLSGIPSTLPQGLPPPLLAD